MRKSTKRFGGMVAVALLVGAAGLAGEASAQGRGGGQGQGKGGGQGQGGGYGQGQGGGYGQGQGGGYGQGAGDQMRQRDRIHVDGSQQQRLQDCSGSAQRLRQHAQGIGANAGNAALASMDRDQLRTHSETMFRQHEEFVAGLGQAERDQLGRPLGRLEQTRSQIQVQMQTLDRALAAPDPDAKQIARASRELERQLNRWENQYRNFSGLFGPAD